MKRFDFPLERVRRWRRTEMDIERAALEKLFTERRRLEQAVRDLDSQVRASQKALWQSTGPGATIDPRRLVELDDFRAHVRREQHRIRRLEQQLHVQIVQQQAKLMEARRRHQLLERLRERALSEWEVAFQKELEDTASELFLAKHARERRLHCRRD
jgi:flagellar export protein FliJ